MNLLLVIIKIIAYQAGFGVGYILEGPRSRWESQNTIRTHCLALSSPRSRYEEDRPQKSTT
ncbi:hypothetical protein HHX47_DHR5000594 [Lentinula edodes]|nr:hypothetical protein HHX47_DHR5000594 [Lentinula edodes]